MPLNSCNPASLLIGIIIGLCITWFLKSYKSNMTDCDYAICQSPVAATASYLNGMIVSTDLGVFNNAYGLNQKSDKVIEIHNTITDTRMDVTITKVAYNDSIKRLWVSYSFGGGSGGEWDFDFANFIMSEGSSTANSKNIMRTPTIYGGVTNPRIPSPPSNVGSRPSGLPVPPPSQPPPPPPGCGARDSCCFLNGLEVTQGSFRFKMIGLGPNTVAVEDLQGNSMGVLTITGKSEDGGDIMLTTTNKPGYGTKFNNIKLDFGGNTIVMSDGGSEYRRSQMTKLPTCTAWF